MPIITDEKRANVVNLMQQGKTQVRNSKALKVSRCAVQNIIMKFKTYKNVQDLPRSGRLLKTSVREKRNPLRLSKRHPKWTANMLRKVWSSEQPVCLTTVKGILRK